MSLHEVHSNQVCITRFDTIVSIDRKMMENQTLCIRRHSCWEASYIEQLRCDVV